MQSVLVVEDDSIFATALAKHLIGAGFVVETAADTFAALNMVNARNYDMLLLDLAMPSGKPSGLSFARMIGASVTTPVMAAVLWNQLNHRLVLGWAAGMLVWIALRLGLWLSFWRNQRNEEKVLSFKVPIIVGVARAQERPGIADFCNAICHKQT